MAFGDLKGHFGTTSGSPGTGISATGSVAVAVGDLIFCNYALKIADLGVRCTGDNLGTNYRAARPLTNTSGGGARPNTWFAIVTASGTLTSVTFAHTTTTGDVGFSVCVFEGPFPEQGALYYPACSDVVDSTSPNTAPATGTLPTVDCLVIGAFGSANGPGTIGNSGSFVVADAQSTGTGANTAGGFVVYFKPPNTSSVSPEATNSAAIATCCSTLVFLKDTGAALGWGKCIDRFVGYDVSILASQPVYGAAKVDIGDLVIVAVNESTSLTATAASDNLGNAYSAINAGTDAGAMTLRGFYSRVTNAGYITPITVTCSASADDFVALAAAYKGPFVDPPLDMTPANTTDITSPFTTTTSGTLTQADELIIVIGADVTAAGPQYVGNSPLVRDHDGVQTGAFLSAAIMSAVVSSTADTAYSFTKTSDPTAAVQTIATFKKASGAPASTAMPPFHRRPHFFAGSF
jgi:hypothetical protein